MFPNLVFAYYRPITNLFTGFTFSICLRLPTTQLGRKPCNYLIFSELFHNRMEALLSEESGGNI